MRAKHFFTTERGQSSWQLANPKRLEADLLKRSGKYYFVIHKERKERDLSDNRFFHGVVIPAFCDFTGEEDPDIMKGILKAKFLKEFNEQGEFVRVRGVRELDGNEWPWFITKCRNLAQSYGFYVPHKGEIFF